jgi:hypothetical protein
MAHEYEIELTPSEKAELDALPLLRRAPVGSVLAALEAKACMTAHQRALPRLYDELNSSQLTVHGATDHAIAVGFAMANISSRYLSSDLNKQNRATHSVWSTHDQPRDASARILSIVSRTDSKRSGLTSMGVPARSVANESRSGAEMPLRSSHPKNASTGTRAPSTTCTVVPRPKKAPLVSL